MIVATSPEGVIGRDGSLPWKISADLKYFRRVTTTDALHAPAMRAVLMGRKTWESLGRALPKRRNIIVSRSQVGLETGWWAKSLAEAIDIARTGNAFDPPDPEPIIIGGARMYAEAFPLATRVYLTTVGNPPSGGWSGDAHWDPRPLLLAAERGEWTVTEEDSAFHEDTLSYEMVNVTWRTFVRVETG
jgi:dihydrofolate reductase